MRLSQKKAIAMILWDNFNNRVSVLDLKYPFPNKNRVVMNHTARLSEIRKTLPDDMRLTEMEIKKKGIRHTYYTIHNAGKIPPFDFTN